MAETNQTGYLWVLPDRPLRMLLSRELMPRYAQFSPESANIFDNLHMLHGIAYDILSYDGWTIEQKRTELCRVLDAMKYHPADEELARKFQLPHPDMDPRIYYDWMKGVEGDMNRAERHFREAVRVNPGHLEAKHELRLLEMRKLGPPGRR